MSPQPLSGTGGPSRSRATVSSSRWNEAQTGVTCQSSGSLDALLPKPNLTTPGLVVLDAFTLRALAVAADSGLLTWPVSRYLADMQLCSIMHVTSRHLTDVKRTQAVTLKPYAFLRPRRNQQCEHRWLCSRLMKAP